MPAARGRPPRRDAGDRLEVARDLRRGAAGPAGAGRGARARRGIGARKLPRSPRRCGRFRLRMHVSRSTPPHARRLRASRPPGRRPGPAPDARPRRTAVRPRRPAPPVVTPTPAPTRPAPVDARCACASTPRTAPTARSSPSRARRSASRARCGPPSPASATVVQIRRGGKVVKRMADPLRRPRRLQAEVKLRKLGRLNVRAIHAGTRAAARRRSEAQAGVRCSSRRCGYGSSGPLVQLFPRGLDRCSTRRAPSPASTTPASAARVMAYRKVNGLRADRDADAADRPRRAGRQGRLQGRATPTLGQPRRGRPLPQVLALVDGEQAHPRLPHVIGRAGDADRSSGRSAFYSKTIGTNAKGMVDSNYFIRGYAIHGYASVPPYNASHGCLRVPIPDARNDLQLDRPRRQDPRRRLGG